MEVDVGCLDDQEVAYHSQQVDMEAIQEELRRAKAELKECREEKEAALVQSHMERQKAATEIDSFKKSVAEQLSISKFGLERFSTDNDAIKFYSRQMQPIDDMFMMLVRLRRGLFERDLADRFHIRASTVSRKIITWANYLYFLLGGQPIWPSREAVQSYMPEEFRNLYPYTRVILDCTEISVQTPSSLLLQSQLYSSYKSKTTLKALLGITPHGAISFVSALYTGGISDKEITWCCGILDLLEPGDSVMADKGFDVEALLKEKGISLNIPPFLEKQQQFSQEHVKEIKNVERAIRRVKEFHLFDSTLPLASLGSLNQMFTVACLLTNFQGPLIRRKHCKQNNSMV